MYSHAFWILETFNYSNVQVFLKVKIHKTWVSFISLAHLYFIFSLAYLPNRKKYCRQVWKSRTYILYMLIPTIRVISVSLSNERLPCVGAGTMVQTALWRPQSFPAQIALSGGHRLVYGGYSLAQE